MAQPAIERAARLGDGWLASPHLTLDAAGRDLERYAEACEKAGRPRGTAAIRRDVYVGATDAEAARTGGAVVAAGYRGFPAGATAVGSAESVSEHFAALRAQGYDDVIVRNLVPDPEAALASTRRLARVRELLGA